VVSALARTAGDDMATAIIETGSKDRMLADLVVRGPTAPFFRIRSKASVNEQASTFDQR
jgi:hypothetical protein